MPIAFCLLSSWWLIYLVLAARWQVISMHSLLLFLFDFSSIFDFISCIKVGLFSTVLPPLLSFFFFCLYLEWGWSFWFDSWSLHLVFSTPS
jgi:hypothetical protein